MQPVFQNKSQAIGSDEQNSLYVTTNFIVFIKRDFKSVRPNVQNAFLIDSFESHVPDINMALWEKTSYIPNLRGSLHSMGLVNRIPGGSPKECISGHYFTLLLQASLHKWVRNEWYGLRVGVILQRKLPMTPLLFIAVTAHHVNGNLICASKQNVWQHCIKQDSINI